MKCSLGVECLSVSAMSCFAVLLPFNFHFSQLKSPEFSLVFYSLRTWRMTKPLLERAGSVIEGIFFVQFSIMHNRTNWETRGSKVELCEIAHLFFSNSFGVSWTRWKVHKLYANEMNICFPSFHQNFCLSVHVLYAWDILFPCVTGRACLFTGMKMEMRHEMCSRCLTG